MKRKFEEILEECLSAQLEGRRSIEDSLSLYPSMVRELEPLLRTAATVSVAFEALTPPSYLQERGRLRFLAASSERLRAREIARGVWGFSRARIPWNFRHWGLLGSGVTAALALLVAGAVLIAGGNGGNGGSTVINHSTPTPGSTAEFVASFEVFRDTLDRLKEKAARGAISSEDLAELREATLTLADAGQPPDEAFKQQVQQALNDTYALSLDLSENAPEDQQDDLQDLLSTTQDAADDLGVAIFTPIPTVIEPPVATETPVQTPAPTGASTPTAPATETPLPTEAPTPTATPPLQGVE